ncbi:hypothetical protein JYU34_006246 [Plutella xylostella]|uniref:Uncharacterized protein n=1 Tax=Plutella xylostella TaxID=51655 RepID=A0ABQ7QRM1_PLUXY|nr:hypothetical protein JYU34_006246 [Plutella xylostella]
MRHSPVCEPDVLLPLLPLLLLLLLPLPLLLSHPLSHPRAGDASASCGHNIRGLSIII